MHLDHQQRVTFDAFTTGGAPLGQAIASGGGATRTFANGDYVMRIAVLKALGGPATAGHTKTFTFTSVKIPRP